jgi:hypothetical protein
MGGYDQFSSLQFYILHIIYVVCSFVLAYYNMLYLSVLILQSSCLYYYLFISSCSAIIHEPCLYTYFIYMIYMLHMLCVLMIHIVMDIFEIMLSMFDYLLYVITIMLIYGIKMVRKMPIILTRNVRYDLQEQGRSNQRPNNAKELFNLSHAQLRNHVDTLLVCLKCVFPY